MTSKTMKPQEPTYLSKTQVTLEPLDEAVSPTAEESSLIGSQPNSSQPYDLIDEIARQTALNIAADQIVVSLGISFDKLGQIMETQDFKTRLESLLPEPEAPDVTRKRFLRKVSHMVDKLEHLALNAKDERVQLNAVRDYLDRAGQTPVRRVATLSLSVDKDRKRNLAQTLKELQTEGEVH